MMSLPDLRRLRATLLFTTICGSSVVQLSAADAKTQMAPFHVEAEFRVDGLRIQNSTSVLNQYLLEQHGVAQLQDISGIAPNLFSSNSDSRGFGDVFSLRGLANSLFFSSPSVALYVDGVPSGSIASYPSALLHVDSLVIKAGPQGTDYGRNAAGGVIEINSPAPGSTHRGRILVDRGSFDASAVHAAFDGPVSDDIGYSATIGYQEREGYIHNSFLNRSADDRRSFAARGALHFKASDNLHLRVGVLTENVGDAAPRLSSLYTPLSSIPTVDPFVVMSDHNGNTTLDRQQFSFQARRAFGWGDLVATTAWQQFNIDSASTDLDLSPMRAAFSRIVQDEESWTQEIRLTSKPGANKATWRAGLFYMQSETRGDAAREFLVPPSPQLPVPPGFMQHERTLFAIDQDNLAGYANADFPLTPQTTAKLGVRVEQAWSDIARTKASSNNFGLPSPQDAPLDASQDDGYVSATAGLVQSVSESLSLQVRTSIAHRPEGFSGFTADPRLARFDSERSWANEIGVTFGPPQGRFGGSILGFWNIIDDYQFERTVPGSTDFVVVNAAEVRSRGVEAKFMWSPVERIWWDFQAGYTEATFENHRDANGASVNGRHVPFIPRYTLRTGVTVDLGRGFSGNVSYAAFGETFFDERNTAFFAQESYGIVSANVRYQFGRFGVTVYGHNLADKEYYQFINPEIAAGSPGAPQRFGVQLSYSY